MSDVYIVGTGQTSVTQGEVPVAARLASQAIARVIEDSDVDRRGVSTLYSGNMLAGLLERQQWR